MWRIPICVICLTGSFCGRSHISISYLVGDSQQVHVPRMRGQKVFESIRILTPQNYSTYFHSSSFPWLLTHTNSLGLRHVRVQIVVERGLGVRAGRHVGFQLLVQLLPVAAIRERQVNILVCDRLMVAQHSPQSLSIYIITQELLGCATVIKLTRMKSVPCNTARILNSVKIVKSINKLSRNWLQTVHQHQLGTNNFESSSLP